MSGHWPPGWEDPEEEFPEEADQIDTEAEARLSEVAAYLASVPVPVMPDAVETRINEALAAEAAGSHAHGPAPVRARVRRQSFRGHSGGGRRVRRHGSGGRSRRDFLLRRPVVVVGSLVVCLLLAGLGFTLARGSTPETASSSAAAPAAGVSSARGSSAAGSSAAGSSAPALGPVKAAGPAPRASSFGSQYAGSESSFLVTASGTKYQRATLAGQARAKSAGSASAGAAVGTAPSAALRGCVLALTGGALPRLVDRATYQGEPAYVVISSTRVWVVGLGCTAAKTELIVSVALAGLPGNLRALVSVEQ